MEEPDRANHICFHCNSHEMAVGVPLNQSLNRPNWCLAIFLIIPRIAVRAAAARTGAGTTAITLRSCSSPCALCRAAVSVITIATFGIALNVEFWQHLVLVIPIRPIDPLLGKGRWNCLIYPTRIQIDNRCYLGMPN